MSQEYKKLEQNFKRDWIKSSNFEIFLEKKFYEIKENEWRHFLFKYSFKYYKAYHSDWLDEAFIFIEEELKNSKNRNLLKDELTKIREEIVYTKNEFSWSLGSIAEAVERLLSEKLLTKNCIRKVINHILFAYSCHMDESKFLTKENALLCSWFEKIKNGEKFTIN